LTFAKDRELAEKLIKVSYPDLSPTSLLKKCSLVEFVQVAGKEGELLLEKRSVQELKEKFLQLEEALVKALTFRVLEEENDHDSCKSRNQRVSNGA